MYGKYKITGIVGIDVIILLPPFQAMQTGTFPAEFKVQLVTYLLPGRRTGVKRRIIGELYFYVNKWKNQGCRTPDSAGVKTPAERKN